LLVSGSRCELAKVHEVQEAGATTIVQEADATQKIPDNSTIITVTSSNFSINGNLTTSNDSSAKISTKSFTITTTKPRAKKPKTPKPTVKSSKVPNPGKVLQNCQFFSEQ